MIDFILDYLEERKANRESGHNNCIPLPFKRLGTTFPGFEQGSYVIVTSNQKIGKSKFCDFLFVYSGIRYLIQHPEDGIKLKVLYFTLEMSPRSKYLEFLSHLLYTIDGIEIAAYQLESTDPYYVLEDKVLDKLRNDPRYKKYIDVYEQTVTYNSTDSNPTGIYKFCENYALQHGHLNHIDKKIVDKDTGFTTTRQVLNPINPYTADDPNEYVVVIIDNAANLTYERDLTEKRTIIEKLSKYLIILRDRYNFIPVLIQHQAQNKESLENIKSNYIRPTTDALADARTTSRDSNIILGLYSPYKYGIKEYAGYDITRFRDNIRFLEILEDRNYGSNGAICPLYFNGASSYWEELPPPEDPDIEKICTFVEADRMEKNKKKDKILETTQDEHPSISIFKAKQEKKIEENMKAISGRLLTFASRLIKGGMPIHNSHHINFSTSKEN